MKGLWRYDLFFLFCIALALLLSSLESRAEIIPATSGTLYGWPTGGIATVHASEGAACSAGAAAFSGAFCSGPDFFIVSTVVNSVGSCSTNNKCVSNSSGQCIFGCDGAATHSGGYSTAAGGDTCPSGYQLSGGQCYGGCTGGTPVSSGIYAGTESGPAAVSGCDSGCTSAFSGGMLGRIQVGGTYQYFWEGAYTQAGAAETCIEGDPSPGVVTALPQPSCGPGQTPGIVNGQTVCFTAGGDPVNPNNGEPETPGVTTEETTTGPNGETIKTTKHPDGSKTIETTFPDGSKTITQEGADPLKTHCEKFPKDDVCSKSAFGGTCSTAFTCEGDAAACAVAKAASELNCKFAATTESVNDVLFSSGLAGQETAWKAAQESNTFDLSSLLEFDQRSVAAASCPGPYTFTLPASIGGQEVGISMQFLCDIAEVVGAFLLIGATVLGLRIVAEGF